MRQSTLDILFRLGIYRGITMRSPTDLVKCSIDRNGLLVRRYKTELNTDHALSTWLLDDCDGPWAIRMERPYHYRRTAIAFARTADAIIFRILAVQYGLPS